MKTLNEHLSNKNTQNIKYPKSLFNPNIEDIIDYNSLNNNDLSFFDIKNIEKLLWHDKLGPTYDIYCENRLYENLNKSYSTSELIKHLLSNYNNEIYDYGEIESSSEIKSLIIYIKKDNILYNEEFKSLLNFYNYYVSFVEFRNNYYEVYIEPFKPEEKTNYIYNDCKGIVYRYVDDNGLKRLKHHGLVPRHDINRYYPRYIFVVANPSKDELNKILKLVPYDIKKKNLHLIKINLNKYENKLRFYVDPASVNYDAFVTREYIPKYCCEEVDLNTNFK